MSDSITHPVPSAGARARAGGDGIRRSGARVLRAAAAIPPELVALLVLAGVLNLWALDQNGFANEYYAAAVRSMSTSWHDFLYASMDRSGAMTVDKPPLALWVQALSVRVFGFHSLAILVPQTLMGMASVVLVWDLVRRRFGRWAGLAGGLALALTPIAVAVSRHNNPDALLVLCMVGALWCVVRWLDDPRMRWLVWAGVAVGLGFETKMAAALLVVPGIALAVVWVAPRGRLSALRQLGVAGVALAAVGLAWPLLMWLTPAADRPWVSGTSDNSIWSLITGYNGLGRVDGQAGGPGGIGGGAGPGGAGGGGGGGFFGGSPGPLRLLNEALGGQAGWLLGFALVGGIGLLVATRLRRSDARTGWLIAVGGALLVTAVVFSHAQGIFHPYYTSELAPFAAALVGATVGFLLRGGRAAMVLAPFAIAAGLISELIVLGNEPGTLTWLEPVLVFVCVLAGIVLAGIAMPARARAVVVAAVLAVLLIAPAAWSFETLGHATSGTFPAGGPASQTGFGGPGGGPGGGTRQGFPPGGGRGFGRPPGAGFGAPGGAPPMAQGFGARPGGAGGAGGMFGGGAGQLSAILAYVKAHGGGTIAVSSQSTAAASIISSDANVAGIGGFSGRESDVSAAWLAQEVANGHIRWVVVDGSTGGAGGAGGSSDGRTGATKALAAVAKAGTAITIGSSGTSTSSNGGTSGSSGVTLYDVQGKAAAIRAAGSGS